MSLQTLYLADELGLLGSGCFCHLEYLLLLAAKASSELLLSGLKLRLRRSNEVADFSSMGIQGFVMLSFQLIKFVSESSRLLVRIISGQGDDSNFVDQLILLQGQGTKIHLGLAQVGF
mmetsp:Transcript_23263/g.35948  ORF Transcript_23263/g.35948 Transcript_23263/m.35948 type:complete len:118 (-) Transcript_23263:1383-1736(-)